MIIDLKNCDFYMSDGNAATGAINLMAGYVAGSTSIVVDGFTGIVPVGSRLNFTGDGDDYTVVSTIETSGATTTIVFTPGTEDPLTDNQVITAGTNFIRMRVGDGNVTWDETKAREYKMDRGRIFEVRNGDEAPMDVSFQLMYEELTASDPTTDPPTPEDVLKKRGAAAAWVTSDNASVSARCRPYSVNIEIIHTPLCTDEKKEKVVLPWFRYEKLTHDPKTGMISCTGKCLATEAQVSRLARS